MKAIKDPVRETYGINYSPYFTEEFDKLIESAKEKIEPFSKKDISQSTVYFLVNDIEADPEYDTCDNEKCIEKTKKDILKNNDKNVTIEEVYYPNDGDHEQIETCCQCGKPLNEWLTWCISELEYLEDNKPWTPEFLKEEAFLIHCIFQSSPTQDHSISEYAKYQGGDILKNEIERRAQFFQRVGQLASCVLATDFN